MDGFWCQCKDGWSGLTCEVPPDSCYQHQCQNEGVCVPDGDTYTCICDQQHSGDRCELNKGKCIHAAVLSCPQYLVPCRTSFLLRIQRHVKSSLLSLELINQNIAFHALSTGSRSAFLVYKTDFISGNSFQAQNCLWFKNHICAGMTLGTDGIKNKQQLWFNCCAVTQNMRRRWCDPIVAYICESCQLLLGEKYPLSLPLYWIGLDCGYTHQGTVFCTLVYFWFSSRTVWIFFPLPSSICNSIGIGENTLLKIKDNHGYQMEDNSMGLCFRRMIFKQNSCHHCETFIQKSIHSSHYSTQPIRQRVFESVHTQKMIVLIKGGEGEVLEDL